MQMREKKRRKKLRMKYTVVYSMRRARTQFSMMYAFFYYVRSLLRTTALQQRCNRAATALQFTALQRFRLFYAGFYCYCMRP